MLCCCLLHAPLGITVASKQVPIPAGAAWRICTALFFFFVCYGPKERSTPVQNHAHKDWQGRWARIQGSGEVMLQHTQHGCQNSLASKVSFLLPPPSAPACTQSSQSNRGMVTIRGDLRGSTAFPLPYVQEE